MLIINLLKKIIKKRVTNKKESKKIALNDIKMGLWLIKKENAILTLSIKPNTIWQIMYNIELKKHKAIIYKNNQLYQSDQKTIIEDEKQITSFINRTKISKNQPKLEPHMHKSELD